MTNLRTRRRGRAAWLALAIMVAPAFAGWASAQTCPNPSTQDCRTKNRFQPSGCTPYHDDLNQNLGDFGSIFLDAITPGCMEDAREYLYSKVFAQNANPLNWQQWLRGGDVYLMTAAALRLGDVHLLTPDLHQQILQALDDFAFNSNGACDSSGGNSCMDNYSVYAAGSAWAAAYLNITQSATPGGRTVDYFFHEAKWGLDHTFSPTESICIHRVAASQPYDVCNDCQVFSDPQADMLKNEILNGEVEVLSFEHTIENPNYGAGLLPTVSIALWGLEKAGQPYTASPLQKVIAHGLFRTAQLHANAGSGACSATWLSNCPQIACRPNEPCTPCTSANLTSSTCITDTCSPQSCSDGGSNYAPGMSPIHSLLTAEASPLHDSGYLGILLPSPRYQFDHFCSDFFGVDAFFNDGRRVAYNDLSYVWPFVSQPPLAGSTADTTPPVSYIDMPTASLRVPAGTEFYGWTFDSQEWQTNLTFSLDGQALVPALKTNGTRPDVCAAYGLYWKPQACLVGWGFTFTPPAGLASGTHVLRVTAADKFGNVASVDRSFVFDAPPAASFTSSCGGMSCTFDGNGSSDDVGIASWSWSFGDGTTASGAVVSHTYTASGTYTVQLTVTDTAGQTQSTTRTANADQPPTAYFGLSCSGRTCSFDASGSTDDHGISSFAWTFGDGFGGAGMTASHTYSSTGTFTVTLTVTDTAGQTASMSRPANPNLPPIPSFTAACTGRTCSFDGSGSSDDVGITSYVWDFGDRTSASGVTASHTYAASGSFTVTLTVTDTSGAIASTSRTVVPNLPPTASFSASCSARTCSFNAGGSSDDLGISSYSWTFGDGGTGSGVTPSHSYASAAAVTATLTVTDTTGQTASTSLVVNPDLPPTATFTVTCVGRSCDFSATGSSDDIGVTAYAWNFGDGSPAGSGAFANHLYAADGTYTITLTVTDTAGQSAQTTRTVSAVDNPPVASFYVTCSSLTCTAVAEASTDDVGIVNYTWAWGDSQTTSGGSAVSTASHTYAGYATYTITLTVRDVLNQTSSVSHGVTLNASPVPVFTFNCVATVCTVNATGSAGPSPIINYHWDWGDESTTDTAAVTAQHTFLSVDAFQVTLTVTDSAGFNGFVTHTRRVGLADSVGIFDRSDASFHLRSDVKASGINDTYLFFLNAAAGNQPVAGDWNGDGVRSGGKFNDATGEFALSNSLSRTSQDLPVDLQFTLQAPGAGRVPIAGDWNGDGIESAGLYDPATQTFYLRNSLTTGPADLTFTFTGAASGWRPIAGDWDKDGIDSVGLYDPATSTFYLRNSNTTGGGQVTFVFGTPGADRWPVAGDWKAEGGSAVGIYQQDSHTFLLRKKNIPGTPDFQFTTGTGADTPPIAGAWYMP